MGSSDSPARELSGRLAGKRFGVVVVGNSFKGDDGAGPALAALLAERGAPFPFVDASEVPENYGGWVVKQGLDTVVFVDAVDFGGDAGEWKLVPFEDLMHSASSTHRLSLHFLIKYLSEQWKGEALLVGVQPASLKLGEGLSPEVARGIETLSAALVGTAD